MNSYLFFKTKLKTIILLITISSLITVSCSKTEESNPTNPPGGNDTLPELEGKWELKASLPDNISENSVTEMNGKMYLSGGVTSRDTSNRILEYDPATDKWTVFATMPRRLHHHASASIDGVLYVIGGTIGDQQTYGEALSEVYAYNSADGLAKAVAPLPHPVAAGIAVPFNGTIYLFGGHQKFNTGSYYNEVLKYDPQEDKWTVVSSFDKSREHLSAATDGKLIYIAGGRNYHFEEGFITQAFVDTFNPETGLWSTLPNLPKKTSACAAGILNGKLVVMSGEQLNGDGVSGHFMVKESFTYDPEGNAWEEITAMNAPKHGTNAVVIDDVLYLPGGGVAAFSYESTNSNYALQF